MLAKTETQKTKDLARRFSALMEKLKEVAPEKVSGPNPEINERALRDAMEWSNERFKSRKIPTRQDEFSDPLLIADRLVEYAGKKIDSTTLLAAILYPAIRPKEGTHAVDANGMEQIEGKFGHEVHQLVKRTLQFRALDHLELEPGARQSPTEHARDFRLMGLWVAEDPRAVLIRATQFAINLDDRGQKAIERVGTRQPNDELLGRMQDSFYVRKGVEVMAPLAYIAGFPKVRDDINNGIFRLQNPAAYAATSREIGTNGSTTIKKDDHPHFEEQIRKVMDGAGFNRDSYTVELRAKEPYSTHDKAERKQQTARQLGDRQGFRIILHRSAIPNHATLDDDVLQPRLEDAVHKAYANLSRNLGRGRAKRDAQYAAKFKELAALDPIKVAIPLPAQIKTLEDSIAALTAEAQSKGAEADRLRKNVLFLKALAECQDARFDDYYYAPKASKYKAMHDTFAIRHRNGTLVEFEGQIVDEIQHDLNTNHPETGHVVYKTGMNGKGYMIDEWKTVGNEIMKGKPSTRESVFVYGERNEIYHVPHGRLGEFAEMVHGTGAMRDHDVRAEVDAVDPFTSQQRLLENPDARLNNGDRIKSLQLKPRNG